MALSDVFSKHVLEQSDVRERLEASYDRAERILDGSCSQRKSYGLYHLYSHLFSEWFPSVTQEQRDELCAIGILYMEAILYYDELLDRQADLNMSSLLHKHFLVQECVKRLSAIFHPNHEFWNDFERYNREYVRALKLELQLGTLCAEGVTLEFSKFALVARGKSAVAKMIPSAMQQLHQDPMNMADAEKSQDDFAIAFQLFDDLRDYKEDHQRGQLTYVLYQLYRQHGLCQSAPLDELVEAFHRSGLVHSVCDRILEYLDSSLAVCPTQGCWTKYVLSFKQKVMELQRDFISLGALPQ